MFHPHFFHPGFFSGTSDAFADAMRLVSARKVEEDLQNNWRQQRERQLQSDLERIPEHLRVKPIPSITRVMMQETEKILASPLEFSAIPDMLNV